MRKAGETQPIQVLSTVTDRFAKTLMSTADNKFLATIKMPRFSRDVIDAPDFHTNTQSGRVAFDERGNGIWEWQTAPGVFSRDISSQQMLELQANELQVVDEEHSSSAAATSVWTRRALPRKVSKDVELVMPVRRRQESSRGFEGFLRRLGLPA